jgi:nicotinamidase-related amidase
MTTHLLSAEPYPLEVELSRAALLLIDFQNDFCSPGGWAHLAGLDIDRLSSAIPPARAILQAARRAGLPVIHTREGHQPDLADCPPGKQRKMRRTGFAYGQEAPRGRLFVRGTWNNEIIEAVAPLPEEPVIDKPGKGAFYATPLESMLTERNIETLIVCGLTTHVCVASTLREAADRGFDTVLVADACQSYEPHLHEGALEVLRMPAALFGWLTRSENVIRLLGEATGRAGRAW